MKANQELINKIANKMETERHEVLTQGFDIYDDGVVTLQNPWGGAQAPMVEVMPHVASLVDYIYGYHTCATMPFTEEEKADLLSKYNWARKWIADNYPVVYKNLID